MLHSMNSNLLWINFPTIIITNFFQIVFSTIMSSIRIFTLNTYNCPNAFISFNFQSCEVQKWFAIFCKIQRQNTIFLNAWICPYLFVLCIYHLQINFSPHVKIVHISIDISSLLLEDKRRDKPSVQFCLFIPQSFYFYIGIQKTASKIKMLLMTYLEVIQTFLLVFWSTTSFTTSCLYGLIYILYCDSC